MSNFIPMVSSSPPPLEDGGGGFNEWDNEDDEFGTFATASVGNDFEAFSDQSSADQWNNIPDIPPNCDFGKFADFSNFSSDSKIDCMQNGDTIPEALNSNTFRNDSMEDGADDSVKSGCMKLSLKSSSDFVNSENIRESPVVPSDDHHLKMRKSQSGNLDSISSVISAGDSGLCSTDISPVPQSDENVGLEDKSQESDLDVFGDFHSDSSMGKEVLRGSTENIDVIEKQGGIGEIVYTENDEKGTCKGSSNSNNQVLNMIIPESVDDQEIRTSHLNEDNMCESVSKQGAHDQVSPDSLCENTYQYTSPSTSSTDTCTSKNDHSKREESLPCTNTEDRTDSGQSKNQTLTTDGDHNPDVNETDNVPDTIEINCNAEESMLVDVDVGEICLDVDPNTKDTPSVQDRVNTDTCGDTVSDEVKEYGHNDIYSKSNDVIRTDSIIKAVSDLEICENQESVEVNLKHLDSAAFDEADETFRMVGDSETDCGFTEQSQEMKDSGFVFTDLSSSSEENSEKKEKETEANLEENCDISKQTVDNDKEFVIDNEVFCEDSVSPGRKDVQVTENDNTKPEPPPVLCSDDEFDDFADFHSASQFSVQNQSSAKSGNDSTANWSTPAINENKLVDKGNKDDEFDDFADFHSSKPPENDMSESLPQIISNKNEKSNSDFNSGNCNDDDVDDFADFSSHFNSESSKNNSGTSTELTDEVKSGWDGFNAFPSASAADGNHQEEDEWATFQGPPTADQVGAGSNDDDFGDFEDFEHAAKPRGFLTSNAENFAAFKEPEPAVAKPVVKQTTCDVITSCFPESVVVDQDVANRTPLLLEDCCHRDVTPDDKSVTGPQIWVKLKSPNTIQLSKLWSESHSNTKLFTTLRIDTRNILLGHRKPSVPMYAANLTLLEPTKGPTPPSEGKSDANKLVDTSKVDDKPASQDLPPVQFDWSNSGLTNPLEGSDHDIAAEIANSKSLELDFLVVKEAEAVAKMGVFDSELMHGQRDPKMAMQPLENILANLKTNSTMRQVRPAENLTPEATKVISCLPNLSFMKARALMFPFKQSSDVA